MLCVSGVVFVQPFLYRKIKLHDAVGINNLHGMPGIMGGLCSIIATAIAQAQVCGIVRAWL